MNDAETRYSTIEKELLAIVWSCKYFRHYLYGKHFTIATDHKPLVWLMNVNDPSSRLMRWRLRLEEFDSMINYKKGTLNQNADALSRRINHLTQEDEYKIFLQDYKHMRKTYVQVNNLSNFITIVYKDADIIFEKDKIFNNLLSYFTQEKYNVKTSITQLKENNKDYVRKILNYLNTIEGLNIELKKVELTKPPIIKRGKIVQQFHGGIGHLGISKTIEQIPLRYTWPLMNRGTPF